MITRRILGIDPGLRVTGFGLIVVSGNRLQYVTSGCIRNTAGELPERLKIILRDLASVIAAHQPTEVAIEKVFVNVNPQSTLCSGRRAARPSRRRSSPIFQSPSTPRCRSSRPSSATARRPRSRCRRW